MSEARQGLRDGGPGTEEDRVAVLLRCILRTRVRHEILLRSNYVLVSVPLTEQTHGLISREAFSNCNPSAVLINVGRRPIVDEGAPVEALTNGTIGGAGLDMTTVELLPRESPLWKLDTVLLGPHNMDMTQCYLSKGL